jgi:DNA-binding NarL/FixJ family response regulator
MRRVFLVEDSPLVLDRMKALVGGIAGAEVVGEATTAPAAIRGILQARPDLVLLDLNLAEGSGFDVLRALHPRLPEVEFYMLSNFSELPYQQLAERLGAAGYFDKTHEFERLRGLIGARADTTHA